MPFENHWLAAPPAGALILILACAPVRRAYGNGWRCAMRFPSILLIPAFFTCCHILFSTGALALAVWQATGRWPWALLLPSPNMSLADNALPALETVAAMLNCLVATFPLSAVFALLFLLNYRGLTVVLGRDLWRRHRLAGVAGLAVLVACALAAMVKPPAIVLGLMLDESPLRSAVLQVQYILNALSFVFEYLIGTCFQLYLLLMAYLWVRGMKFDHDRLMRFAVRRIAFVLKWALVVITATLLGLHLPVLVASLWFPGDGAVWFYETTQGLVRPALALAMVAGAATPITLALHNNTLRQAFATGSKLACTHAWPLAAFLGSAFLLAWTAFLVPAALGASPAADVASLIQPVFTALLSGWILAAWVCFYKGCESFARAITF